MGIKIIKYLDISRNGVARIANAVINRADKIVKYFLLSLLFG